MYRRATEVAASIVGHCIVGIHCGSSFVLAVHGGSALSFCSPCVCDCPSEARLSIIPPGLNNLSLTDCGKPEIREEMEKNSTDLVSEELRLQEIVAEENQQHAEMMLLDAKKLASQYQKEAEKCNAGIETCEGARERAEASLVTERKATALWEQRARQMGWKDA